MIRRANELTQHASSSAVQTHEPAATVRAFVDALERLGYDVDSLLASAGISRTEFANADARVPCRVLPAILGKAIEAKPIQNFATRLAAEIPIGAFPVVDYLVVASETVGAGLKQLARYLRLTEAPYAVEPKEGEQPIRVLFDKAPTAFITEFGVSLVILHLRRETEQKFAVLSVSFRHSPDNLAELENLLGCAVQVKSSWNGFRISQEVWDLPLRHRDPALCQVLEKHAAGVAARVSDGGSLEREVRRLLASRMAVGEIQIHDVARALATSPRSLQRRLAEKGVSFQSLLDDTRRESAREYLANSGLSIGEIAYLLGYSEPAAFHRAFKRWNGVAPQAFRRGGQ